MLDCNSGGRNSDDLLSIPKIIQHCQRPGFTYQILGTLLLQWRISCLLHRRSQATAEVFSYLHRSTDPLQWRVVFGFDKRSIINKMARVLCRLVIRQLIYTRTMGYNFLYFLHSKSSGNPKPQIRNWSYFETNFRKYLQPLTKHTAPQGALTATALSIQ